VLSRKEKKQRLSLRARKRGRAECLERRGKKQRLSLLKKKNPPVCVCVVCVERSRGSKAWNKESMCGKHLFFFCHFKDLEKKNVW
jgi:hypothetical protein